MKRPPARTDETSEGLSARWGLVLVAIGVLVVRQLVPFGDLILYPFTLFATWVHEMGHGLVGLLVGGTFDSLMIFANGSGLARGAIEPGWPAALRAAGGLLGPPVLGACILAFARGPKRARIVLFALAAMMALSVPIWVRSLTGWIAVPAVAALIGVVALRAGPTWQQLVAQFLGVLLGLDTIGGLDYLFVGRAFVDGRELPSDVSHIATALGGHYLLWGVLIAIVSLALVAVGVRLAWAEDLRLASLARGLKRIGFRGEMRRKDHDDG